MNPGVLETIKALAGISNAERIDQDNKNAANELLGKMLRILAKDVNAVYDHETSQIIKSIPGTTGLA